MKMLINHWDIIVLLSWGLGDFMVLVNIMLKVERPGIN